MLINNYSKCCIPTIIPLLFKFLRNIYLFHYNFHDFRLFFLCNICQQNKDKEYEIIYYYFSPAMRRVSRENVNLYIYNDNY